MSINLPYQDVLAAMNAGLEMHRRDTSQADYSYSAETYFATGYLHLKMEAGKAALEKLPLYDQRIVRIVAKKTIRITEPGLVLDTGADINLFLANEGQVRVLHTGMNLVIAKVSADGYNTLVNIADGISVIGEELMTHILIGDEKHLLIEPRDPAEVIECVIGLIYAGLW